MRELKFKAWLSDDKYKQNEQMLKLEEFKYPLEFWRNYYNWRGSIKVLLWPIGLKDKNNKEIYKEDIVKCMVHGIVTYSVVKMKNGRWVGENKGKAQDDNIFSIKDIEVVGNIYENSELLK